MRIGVASLASNSRLQLLINGLKGLRTGALLVMIAFILIFVSLVLLAGLTYIASTSTVSVSHGFISSGESVEHHAHTMWGLGSPGLALGAVMGVFGLILLGLVLDLIAFFIWFGATASLRDFDPGKLGIGRTGLLLQLIGVIAVIIGVFIAIGLTVATGHPAAMLSYFGIFMAGGILMLVGLILFGIMLIRLGDIPGISSGFRTAGILYILSIIPYIGTILGIAAAVLIYIYAGQSIRELEKSSRASIVAAS